MNLTKTLDKLAQSLMRILTHSVQVILLSNAVVGTLEVS